MLKSQIEIPDRVGRICEGLIPYFKELVVRTGENNSSTIVDFLLAIRIENNISLSTKSNYIVTISFLSSFHKNKLFKQMIRDDILSFLDSFRKQEVSDPLHRWIGTYNNHRVHLIRFFRWLYYPNLEQKKAPKAWLYREYTSTCKKGKKCLQTYWPLDAGWRSSFSKVLSFKKG